jgi:hypothetical protein
MGHTPSLREVNMSTSPKPTRAVRVSAGGYPGASAELTLADSDTAEVCFHIDSGHLPVATRDHLVDAVFAEPGVQQRRWLRATIPLGDWALLQAFRAHCPDLVARPAGATCLLEVVLDPARDWSN